ncbi:pentapeptide repeat-containing protein [cf. Phormidesmis sp. LEGE 11477]|uniref:pentapeptide repeat-containing protein n=1 Tax=cf. Phormidesmis sp. LEGE 11477 TaxID=1828680 RepID=UPI00187F6F1A|nr:pentapeptide repeat-containing protein [cf. Phormidesmis sp. LEGE 11477]MBE9059404.1 pentapeptide repeat-containing protein [cf. Phormidesmis sp. LEGE 11477]
MQTGQGSDQPPVQKIRLGDEAALVELKQCFQQLRRERNLVDRQYRILQEAERREIPLDQFEMMFAQYCDHHALTRRSGSFLRKAADVIGQLSILFGLFLFIAESGSRKQQANEQAWGVVIAAQRAQIANQSNEPANELGNDSHLGRISALESLNEGCRKERELAQQMWLVNLLPWEWPLWRPKCATLRGILLTKVHLPRIQLPYATLRNANFTRAGLWSANFKGADLSDAVLERAWLNDAELSEANLTGVNLRGADLSKSELEGAILLGTDFSDFPGTVEEISPQKTKLTPAQLEGALVCGVLLPKFDEVAGNELDPQRDCSTIESTLHERYPNEFENEAAAKAFVDSLLAAAEN